MCFSAPASFIASGGLIVLGGASLVVAKKEEKILAAIPFMFGIQQGIEGIQWLYLNAGHSSLVAAYGFLFFASIVWPVYVPVFVYILDKKRRRMVRWFIFLGSAVALYFLCIFLTHPMSVSKLNACVSYNYHLPFKNLVNTAYLVAVFGSLFASSLKIFRWFGLIGAVLAVATWLFFTATFVSVWCFFAAVVSSMFFMYVRSNSKRS